MSTSLVIRPEAEADVRAAFRWYEEKLPGLGASFLAELDRELLAIAANPQARARVHHEIRRSLIRRFPYGVFHVVGPGRVVVLAVLHSSRDPRLWERRPAGDS